MLLIDLAIEKAVRHAEQKHPVFAESGYQVVSILAEETGEFAQAINDKDFNKAESEALDIIAVCIRFLKEKGKVCHLVEVKDD